MKTLTSLLQKGNLTPKERVMLLVHNRVAEDMTGKEVLTEADKHALCEGWKPKDNYEAKEYNRYNDGWRTEGGAGLDAQTAYLNAQISLLESSRVVDYALWTDLKDNDHLGPYKKEGLDVNEDDVLSLVLKNSGLAFDRVVYGYAFQNLSEDLKKDALALYPDIETESCYLDQEEILADLFNDKDQLTIEAKEKLVDLITDTIHNKYNHAFIEKGLKCHEWWFRGYYAELPIIEIAKKCAEYNGINYEVSDEDLDEAEKTQKNARTVSQLIGGDASLDKEFRKEELSKEIITQKINEYAEKQKIDMGELLRQSIFRWLDEGLFVKEYTPMWNSLSKSTCNNMDTKLSHGEFFKEWLKVKAEAKSTMQKMIDEGQLIVENRSREFLGVTENVKIITGESLYNLNGDFAFVEDYKKQVEDFKLLGRMIVFLQNRDFLEGYAHLLGFVDIFKKLSKIYEIDLSYKINKFIGGLSVGIKQLKNELFHVADKLEEATHLRHNIKFSIEIFVDSMLVNLEEIKPIMGETETHYFNELKEIFGDEF